MEVSMSDTEQLNKWRLILGKYSQNQISFQESSEYMEVSQQWGTKEQITYMDMEDLLDYLYSRELGDDIRKEGGSENSKLTVANWITKIRTLFPKKTIEVLERHALENYKMTELLTDKEVLEKLEPNQELLKTILQLKHLMKGEVLETAKKIVAKVAAEISNKMEQDIRRSVIGKIDRNSDSKVKSIRNLDIKRTIRKNLQNYDLENQRLVLENVYFNSRVKNYNKWRVVIAVDESGSMLDCIIHSAIMAGIFAKLPMLDTRLVIFDTQVVDLSGQLEDPVETLMSIQLGGGTDIAGAMAYCETLIDNPHRTIVVLVSDLCEGGNRNALYSVSRSIVESGAKLIALTALDVDANPSYDRIIGQKLADIGAYVGAMTPEQLGDFVGKIMK